MTPPLTVLVVGATGSIGHLVVEEALRSGYRTRALLRNPARARDLPPQTEVVVGDLTKPETLTAAVADVDAVVFTHGSQGEKVHAETVDYGGVRNILNALSGRPATIALMTSIGVTNRAGSYNQATQVHDWKRRSERLVRASGRPYTIVRPGWFDYNAPNQHKLVGLQGDTRHAGNPSDGVVARRQIAEVLIRSLGIAAAHRKTLELVAETGPATTNFETFFASLDPDHNGSLDGVRDTANMAEVDEPERVRKDLDGVAQQRPPAGPRHTQRASHTEKVV